MNITTVVNIIRVDKHIDNFGVETLSETIEEVFDYKQGVSQVTSVTRPYSVYRS